MAKHSKEFYKVLVTGANGFIGKYVVDCLLKKNVKVIATSLNAEDSAPAENIVYINYDLAKRKDDVDLYTFFHCPDALIHLAWEGLPNYTKEYHLTKNLSNHIAFTNNLIRNGLKDITVAGTCFEYGLQEGCFREDMPSLPDNAYARAKNELRLYLENLQKEYNFVLKWTRLFYMYGQGQNPRSLIPQLETALKNKDKVFNMSGGEQTRDFMHVADVAESIVNVALQKKVCGIVNVASNHPVKVKDFVAGYLKQKRKNIKLNLGYYPYSDLEPMHFWGDNNKLKSIEHE